MAKNAIANKTKKDLLLITILLAISAAGFLTNRFIHKKPAVYLRVSVGDQIIQTLPLDQDTDLLIHGADGGTNHLIIQDGLAWVDEASCPDKVCIHQGKVQLTGQMIVCLPNQVIIKVDDTGAFHDTAPQEH